MSFEKEIIDSLKYYSDLTVDCAEALSKSNPEDYLQNFYIGAINGNLGLYDFGQKKYWPAYRKGKKGKDNLQKTLEKKPDFADAELGLGLFQYYRQFVCAIKL